MTIEKGLKGIDYSDFLAELKRLFKEMDYEYDKVAESYGFKCRGCEDNCCYSTFFHHTLLEYLLVKEGVGKLDDAVKIRLFSDATKNIERARRGDKIMCPANKSGLCIIYEYRPMVCRLHGLSHELQKPGQEPVRSPGCDIFTEVSREKEYIKFDRTPFYLKMAELEKKLRLQTGCMNRIKFTLAEMIIK